MPVVDAHQHLYPEGVLRVLEGRRSAPFARWRDGAFTVTLAGEEPFTVDAGVHDPAFRLARMRSAGIQRALVALSSAVGVEALPSAQATPILDAWSESAAALPTGLNAWGAIPLHASTDEQVARAAAALDSGAAGICIPTNALTGGAAAIDRLGPVLHLLQQRLAPLFVHPGAVAAPGDGAAQPEWWAPATTYIADLHAAWLAFVAYGRPAHPRLQVLFAALAGLAPLHAERTAARGGPATSSTTDSGIFYDTSSYGPRAIKWVTCLVGTTQIVDGSDHPVLPLWEPDTDTPTVAAVRADNAARLLGQAWSAS
ncbi:MAG: amidohydrolase 2 [Solirubrobacterales bacterium]|nr:amidohydrolase 2 [Solirubrobacterales bacterium]